MKQKIGTTLDAALYRKAKDLANRQHRSVNAVIEEALERFLAGHDSAAVVAETHGTYDVSPELLEAVLNEDLYDAG